MTSTEGTYGGAHPIQMQILLGYSIWLLQWIESMDAWLWFFRKESYSELAKMEKYVRSS